MVALAARGPSGTLRASNRLPVLLHGDLGAIDYLPFRLFARAQYLDVHVPWATGLFEVKEHAAAIGLALLPAYWAVWRQPAETAARRAFTTFLTGVVWWNFLVGHIVNNIRGL